jgi:hypothetical protein
MRRPPQSTGVERRERNKSFKRELGEYLEERRPAAITEAVWRELLERLAGVSESYLRQLLWATGLVFEQPYAGIRQHTFEELEASLREMAQIYAEAMMAGDRERARYCRRQVIGARARARFAAGKRAEKVEMAAWMLVWLEDPAVFASWVEVRKRVMAGAGA